MVEGPSVTSNYLRNRLFLMHTLRSCIPSPIGQVHGYPINNVNAGHPNTRIPLLGIINKLISKVPRQSVLAE